jgi:ABC-type sugar transport system ATPase subunit
MSWEVVWPNSDRLGIRLIHQDLALAPNLSIADNLFLGREPIRFGLLDRRRLVADAERLRDELGLPELGDVRVRVGELNVARGQLVEIARALVVRVRILVLDEPTASLSESETEALFGKLRRLRWQGVGIIYISHRLEEISRLADRITVLRDGRRIGTQRAADLDIQQLITWMVGRELKEHYPGPPHTPGEVALPAGTVFSAGYDTEEAVPNWR